MEKGFWNKKDRSFKKEYKLVYLSIIFCFALTAFSGCKQTGTAVPSPSPSPSTALGNAVKFNITALKGPTAMGMVKLMNDSESKTTSNEYNLNEYNFSISGTADDVAAKIITGDIDVAAIPCNLASVLYNKTNGEIKVAAINTLGVLYVIEAGNEINSIKDLKGKTVLSTGKGTTPEYTLNYILEKNEIDSVNDVDIQYKSEASEVASLLMSGGAKYAMLPEPFVTTVLSKNPDLRVALDISKEFEAVTDGSIVTGTLIVRNSFLEQNKDAFNQFLAEYKESIDYVNSELNGAAQLIEKYDIAPSDIAFKAITKCNIRFIDGAQMKTDISQYLSILFEANPQAVGGKMPDDDFYYQK